ncbi:MAG: putative peptidoglycan glycosyltransferase FtsW [Oscillospiraceae bacterium]|nr:putative peptidoglycan glycosyltransferase FtsW [Oscillospiraceae bacterium]
MRNAAGHSAGTAAGRSANPTSRPDVHGASRPDVRGKTRKQPERKSTVRTLREKPEAAPRVQRGRMDISFFFLVVTLMAIGLVMVFSASYATSLYEEGSSLKIVVKQAICVALGLVGMLVASYVPYQVYRKLAIPIYLASAALMYLALLFPNKTGARRWIRLGALTFQPSELMKFALAVMFASLIAVNYRRMDNWRYGFLKFMLWLAPALVAAVLQRHLSGMLLLVIIGFGMMFIAGSKLRWFVIPGIGIGVLGALYLSLKGFGYLQTRFAAWQDPFSNIQNGSWQICQSLYAIGSGGLMGVGLGNSTQKYLWVSEPQNDFIFSIVCEELGLLGAVAIILLFVLFVCSGFSIAMRSPDRFSSMLVTGIILQFGVQALLNIAVVSNSMPTTGISLPFFSAGGTATVIQLCQMGVVLGVSRYCRPTLSRLPDPEQKEEDGRLPTHN